MATEGGCTASFYERLQAQWDADKFVCVGLDTDFKKLPPSAIKKDAFGAERARGRSVFAFNQAIIDATCDLVCAYKINSAFYERLGSSGWDAMRNTIAHIRNVAPGVITIWDAKRGDIGNSNDGYVEAWDDIGADAITVHNYLGSKAMEPFLARREKGVFVLCRTSNPGAGEFQDLVVRDGDPPGALFDWVAATVVTKWNGNSNCGLVAGATYPAELAKIRWIVGDDVPLLVPGVGAQGGDLEAAVTAAKNARNQGFILNSSRGIIFASNGNNFAEAARTETLKLHEAITACLANPTHQDNRADKGGPSDGL